MAKCVACGKFISSTGVASCSICPSLYHKGCVSLPESSPVGKGWVCPECKTRTRKGDNTPVRSIMQDASAPGPAARPAAAAPTQRTAPAAAVPPAPAFDLQDVHKEMADWMSEIREFRHEMLEFRASVAGLSARMDSIELRLEMVEQGRQECSPEVADLQCKVVLLQRELNERDQDALLSDLEIGHLPEQRGENVVHTVSVLATKLGVVLDERDIVFAERLGIAQGASAAGEAPRARRVVVRLARRHLRDELLQAARVRRNLSATDAGRDPSAIAGATTPPRTRIFLNERLTRVNRQLFHRVRDECHRLQWKYSWTKRGRVYARQADGKQAYPIRSEEDVKRVFGISSV